MSYDRFCQRLDEITAEIIKAARDTWTNQESVHALVYDSQRAAGVMKAAYACFHPDDSPASQLAQTSFAALAFELDDHVDALARLRREIPSACSASIREDWGIPFGRPEVVRRVKKMMRTMESGASAHAAATQYLELCALLIVLCGMDISSLQTV